MSFTLKDYPDLALHSYNIVGLMMIVKKKGSKLMQQNQRSERSSFILHILLQKSGKYITHNITLPLTVRSDIRDCYASSR